MEQTIQAVWQFPRSIQTYYLQNDPTLHGQQPYSFLVENISTERPYMLEPVVVFNQKMLFPVASLYQNIHMTTLWDQKPRWYELNQTNQQYWRVPPITM